MLPRSTLMLAVLAVATPAFAEDPEPAAATSTTTLRGHRAYKGAGGEPEGLPTGLPGFSSPPVPIEPKKPTHEPQPGMR
jgi:hypothetical protein